MNKVVAGDPGGRLAPQLRNLWACRARAVFIGDEGWGSSSGTLLHVPDFGKLQFKNWLIAGKALASWHPHACQRVNSRGTVLIATGAFWRGGTLFNHALHALETDGSLNQVGQLGGTPGEAPDRYAQVSVFTYAGAGVPPTLLMHGTHDEMAPVGAVRELQARLQQAGAPVTAAYLPHTDHMFDLAGTRWSPAARVAMGGGDVIGPALDQGLVDELRLHLAPRVLGGGTPLFKPGTRQMYRQRQVRPSRNAVHLTYERVQIETAHATMAHPRAGGGRELPIRAR